MAESVSQSLDKTAPLPEVHAPTKLTWYDRLSDLFNAILVKETRQALKSRQFVMTFLLLLAVSWVVAVFGLMNAGADLEYGSQGSAFFDWFYVVLAFAVILIVPFTAYRSLLNERDQETFELLSITALKPSQIVWGKLLTAAIQLFIYYSAITPFIAFCSLMQGFDTVLAAYMLSMTFLLSLLLSMIGLMIGTAGKSRAAQGFLTISVLGLLMFVLYVVYGLVISNRMFANVISLSNPATWWVTLCIVLAGTTYFFLAHQITVNQLTFESANRSSSLRIIFSLQFWLLWAGLVGYHFWNNTAPSRFSFFFSVTISALHLFLWGLFASTEGDHLSHRIRRSIPRRFIFRLIRAPFLPGGSLGYCFILAHLLAMGCIVVFLYRHALESGGTIFMIGSTANPPTSENFLSGLFNLQSQSWQPEIRFTAAAILYVVIFLGFGAFLSRWGSSVSAELKPNHARVMTFLLLTAGIIFPLVVDALTKLPGRWSYSTEKITSPYDTLKYLSSSGWRSEPFAFDWSHPRKSYNEMIRRRGFSEFILLFLTLVTVLALMANFRSIIRAIREVLRPPPDSMISAKPKEKTPTAPTVKS